MEIIENIREIDVKSDEDWIGYEIITNRQTISVLINNCQLCCERYGVTILPVTDIIGYHVKKVKWGRNLIPQFSHYFMPHVQKAIVNIECEEGIIQVVAYNDHNGHYRHFASVKWNGYDDIQEV